MIRQNTVAAGFSDLGFSDHFGFSDQKLGVFGRPTYKQHLGFSDLNRVDENGPLNPAGTVISIVVFCLFKVI